MTLKQVLRLFELRPDIYFEQCKRSQRWARDIELICQHDWQDAHDLLVQIISREWQQNRKHKRRIYYVEAVKRELILLEHERQKTAPVKIFKKQEETRGGMASVADILSNLQGGQNAEAGKV